MFTFPYLCVNSADANPLALTTPSPSRYPSIFGRSPTAEQRGEVEFGGYHEVMVASLRCHCDFVMTYYIMTPLISQYGVIVTLSKSQ